MAGEPSIYYCNDEDLAIRAGGDWPVLAPKDQCDAYGVDGSIGVGSWALVSGSVDFQAAGVSAGQVAILSQQPAVGVVGPLRGQEEFVVVSAALKVLTVRRKGKAAGVGQPPAMAGTTAITFDVRTLAPQISRASYEINRRYGIDDATSGRKATDLYDVLELRDLCCCTVLYRQYLAMARASDKATSDVLTAKSMEYRREMEDVGGRVDVRWAQAPLERSTGPFNCRLER